jgi:hypothetical protein
MELDNYLTIAAIIIALTGGIPGIIGIVKDKVKLRIHCYQLSYGNYEDKVNNVPKQTTLIIPLTVYNLGERPLYAVSFDARILFGKQSHIMHPMVVAAPSPLAGNAYVSPRGEIITTLEPANDLQRNRFVVTRDNPISGFLTFLAPSVSESDLHSKPFYIEFSVFDNSGKKRIFKHVFNAQLDKGIDYNLQRPASRQTSTDNIS